MCENSSSYIGLYPNFFPLNSLEVLFLIFHSKYLLVVIYLDNLQKGREGTAFFFISPCAYMNLN